MKKNNRQFWKIRLSGIFVILVTIWYLSWLIHSGINANNFLYIPFLGASLLLAINSIFSVYNHWGSEKPIEILLPEKNEVKVGIIVPTWGEPVETIVKTVLSVFEQDYPHEKMVLFISDDGHRPEIEEAVRIMAEKFRLPVVYHEPPYKDSPERHGEGKSGALNSVLSLITKEYPDIYFVETRDADDLTPDNNFLRKCLGQLLTTPNAAFVQTIKECLVSEGDPFGNQEPIFYRNTMPSKYKHNSAYSCGSGVVYRKSFLDLIGGFATWNLVEDLYTGIEIFKTGGRGIYLPIVGALGQIAPEDIPNFYKQRGTWAIDALRIFFWRNPIFQKALTFSQKIQFLELGTFYLLGPAMVIFMIETFIILVFRIYPMSTDLLSYSIHFWPYLLFMELFLIVKAEGLPYELIWRSRQTWLGLSTVFTKSLFLALLYGPNKKPRYKVTRKFHVVSFYFKETLPQITIAGMLFLGTIYHIYSIHDLTKIDYGSVFWAIFFVLCLSKTIQNSWYRFEHNWITKFKKKFEVINIAFDKLLA